MTVRHPPSPHEPNGWTWGRLLALERGSYRLQEVFLHFITYLYLTFIPLFLVSVITKTLFGFLLKGRISLTAQALEYLPGEISVIDSFAKYNVCREETYLFNDIKFFIIYRIRI